MSDNGISTEEEREVFFKANDVVLNAIYDGVESKGSVDKEADTNAVVDALAVMLGQANMWGRRNAAEELREWADTLGENYKAVVRLAVKRIENRS